MIQDATPEFLGLDRAERDLLSDLLGDALAPLGLDGRHVLDSLERGEALSTALALPPGLTDVLYRRAYSWFSAGRPDRAENLFRALCILDSRIADHWIGYGVCLRLGNHAAQASLAFATAATLRPDWAVPHFHAAELAAAQQDWMRAADHLRAFVACPQAGLPVVMTREAARLDRALRWRHDPPVAD